MMPYSAPKLKTELDRIIGDKEVQTVIVERQMVQSHAIYRVASHTEMYFAMAHPSAEYIVCDPKLKDLKGVKGYAARKTKAIECAKKYLQEEGMLDILASIDAHKKKDDMCDAICQWLWFCANRVKKFNVTIK
nr:hypothetical protein [Diadromus pulchellus ascovirus 4a]